MYFQDHQTHKRGFLRILFQGPEFHKVLILKISFQGPAECYS